MSIPKNSTTCLESNAGKQFEQHPYKGYKQRENKEQEHQKKNKTIFI
jgi:hypothetical protein